MIATISVIAGTPSDASILLESSFTEAQLGVSGRKTVSATNSTPWYVTGSGSTTAWDTLVVADDPALGGLGRSLTSNATTTSFIGQFDAQTLTEGQMLRLSFDFRAATKENVWEAFRFGLLNNNTSVTADARYPAIQASGYAFWGNPGGTDGPNRIVRVQGATGSQVLFQGATVAETLVTDAASNLRFDLGTEPVSVVFEVFLLDGKTHMRLFHNASGSMELALEGYDENSIVNTFNAIGFYNTTSTEYYYNNIKLEFLPVPEANTISLLVAGGLGLIFAATRGVKKGEKLQQ